MDITTLIDLMYNEVQNLAKNQPEARYVAPNEDVGTTAICRYTSGNVTGTELSGCIIGNALINVYPEAKEKAEEFDKLFSGNINQLLKHIYDKCTTLSYLDDASKEKLTFMHNVQNYQDAGYSWGDALQKTISPTTKPAIITSKDVEEMVKNMS